VALVRVLRREHPHLELVIDNSRRTPDVLKLLREEVLDVGLVGGPVTGAGFWFRHHRGRDPARPHAQLAGGRTRIPTSIVWKSTNDTPVLDTVVQAAERHVADRP
jgi:DNA-binding transcriptional LysR family regulator